jgi:hypothetical protein
MKKKHIDMYHYPSRRGYEYKSKKSGPHWFFGYMRKEDRWAIICFIVGGLILLWGLI